MKNKIEFYEKVLELVDVYKDSIEGDDIIPNEHSLSVVLSRLGAMDLFGISAHTLKNQYTGWIDVDSRYNDYLILGLFGEKYNRTISWSDDGTQPEDEWLLRIGFPTGAYIFGQSYPKETFDAFFNELKTYCPKYCDSANNCLYFSSETAKDIHTAFYDIMQKYRDMVGEETKRQRKKELEDELARLGEMT